MFNIMNNIYTKVEEISFLTLGLSQTKQGWGFCLYAFEVSVLWRFQSLIKASVTFGVRNLICGFNCFSGSGEGTRCSESPKTLGVLSSRTSSSPALRKDGAWRRNRIQVTFSNYIVNMGKVWRSSQPYSRRPSFRLQSLRVLFHVVLVPSPRALK